ncbi:unnamed protein product [Soboliphyme baturini]|uniref:Eukaryotic translation initiation factor 3 subunit I n=1 Tax=Soboliphyme baturini TaxID=241478 RepID=A0A183J2R1_9BILA|nr:unnamed protein product [Soboliphyme baturini]
MRPLVLKGHERAITKVKYNREGDLLFSSAKDKLPTVWYSDTGERLGTYNGHNGVVWCLDVSFDTSCLLTGSGDNSCCLWDCETGTLVNRLGSPTAVRAVGFSYSSNTFFYSTDQRMTQNCSLDVFDTRDKNAMAKGEACIKIPILKSRITSALWGHLDYIIITGNENGEICQFDIRRDSSDPVNFLTEHKRAVMDLQTSSDEIMLLSASKDQTAKLFDAQNFIHLKTYQSERPVNSAAISPTRDHIVLGGGEEAMKVTQTDTRQGQFEAKFYHLIFQEEFARVRGHFGPINSLVFHPDGKSYASGGEDGYVRVHVFDDDYFDFDLDY